MSTLPPPITPAFAWAVPDVAAVEPKAKAKQSPKPVSNPLLKRASPRVNDGHQQQYSNNNTNMNGGFGGLSGASPAATNAGMRLPFSPMDNKTSLRQRRKPSSSTFLPPKSSLTEASYVLDENLETNNIITTTTTKVSTL
jgi:hypothetical protein